MDIPLQRAITIWDVLTVVRNHSSFINCSYLKEVAISFKLSQASKKIDTYYEFVEKFCKHKLTQHSCVTSFLAIHSKHLLSSETITLKLEWNPDDKTLGDIQVIIKKTFKSLASHIHVVLVKEPSVTLICYAPQYLMGALVKFARESREVLVEYQVTYLSVGYSVLLDISELEKVKN